MRFLQRKIGIKGILSIVLLPFFFLAFIPSSSPAKDQRDYFVKKVFVLELKGSINPGSSEIFERAVDVAQKARGGCLIVLLDTPGGLLTSLKGMVQTMMDANIPIVVFVYPPGAQAASAGALLTIAAHVAAMAPGTNIGAAHPMAIGIHGAGGNIMKEKLENAVAAMARSIAQEMGRNATWAELAVRKSASATASEALKLGVVDLISKNLGELLKKMDKMTIRLKGDAIRLRIDSPVVEHFKPTFRERVLSAIADPNIAYILMMIGIAGLYFELAHPGTIFPGTIGAISLLLALFAMQALPVNATGLLLIVLGVVLFALELFVVSHGILGFAGLASLLLGSIMLFNSSETGVGISFSVLLPTILGIGGILLAIAFLATRATLSRPISGREGLIGEKGEVRRMVSSAGGGLVFIHGELWQAVSDQDIPEGEEIMVTGIEGLKLKVKRL